uniref:Lipocalin/cytosolic fatty-acid binding domain-containing protein n=1 Tax=Amblyomma maculatum TaxID=34609 RepID=G3MR65_AMBMU
MLIYFPALVLFINMFHEVTAGQPYGETRMDYEKEYFKYQDIIKAFNTSYKQWLYGANFDISQQYEAYKCVNFRKDNVSLTELNFTAHYLKDSLSGSTRFYGKLSMDNNEAYATTSEPRERPNSIEVSSTPGTFPGKHFRLIYSDYKNCSILRVPSEQEGSGCIVLLTIRSVKTGLPRFCNSTYQNACGTQRKFYTVFDGSCKLTENPAGC